MFNFICCHSLGRREHKETPQSGTKVITSTHVLVSHRLFRVARALYLLHWMREVCA